MFTMKQHAEKLAKEGIINEKDYIGYFLNDHPPKHGAKKHLEETENE